MSDGAGDVDPAGLAPDEAFDLLGNGVRMEILQALWETDGLLASDTSVPFSELYDRVSARDSGNFTYHLDKLVGHFVEKTADGYRLKQTGRNVVQTVVAGTVTDDPRFGPTEIDAPCPLCDAAVEITYEDNALRCSCTACDGIWETTDGTGILLWMSLPPASVRDRSPEEVFHAMMVNSGYAVAACLSGVCPTCTGRVETTLDVCRDHETGMGTRCPACDRAHMAEATYVCQVCGGTIHGQVRTDVLAHPAVTAFYHDHGIEHRFASWDTYCRSHEIRETLVSGDPLELRLAVPAGDEELRLTVDDELSVTDVRRRSRAVPDQD